MAALDADDLRAVELLRALQAMGPDTDRLLRLTVRAMDGRLVGEVMLSAADTERLRLAAEAGAEAHAVDAGQLLAEAEAILRGGEAS